MRYMVHFGADTQSTAAVRRTHPVQLIIHLAELALLRMGARPFLMSGTSRWHTLGWTRQSMAFEKPYSPDDTAVVSGDTAPL